MAGILVALGGACGKAPPPPGPTATTTTAPAPLIASTSAVAPAPPPPRTQLDGRAFPDKILALTWDDGPDETTLVLAKYLHDEHVPATFFVVGEWVPGLSEEPGQGTRVLGTGHRHLSYLGAMVSMGHRLANHTLNHALLGGASAERVVQQLRDDQEAIAPYQKGSMPLFRVPGGVWSDSASAAIDGDPVLTHLVGPVRWDIDGKDWEGSLYCRSEHPTVECEPAAPGHASRVKPAVIARRYLEQAEKRGHGIVLLHDRVGHVGSLYAYDVARALIPALKQRGFVFAAPVLRFGPLAPHPGAPVPGEAAKDVAASAFGSFAVDPATIRLGDVNGDGRADVCGRAPEGIVCALATESGYLGPSLWLPEMSDAAGWARYGATIALADVNGDGRADVCSAGPEGPVCALAP